MVWAKIVFTVTRMLLQAVLAFKQLVPFDERIAAVSAVGTEKAVRKPLLKEIFAALSIRAEVLLEIKEGIKGRFYTFLLGHARGEIVWIIAWYEF